MASPESGADPTASPSCVYGPVKSWRLGWSLGVDLIQDISTCSFNCVYCQLGDIVDKTAERRIFVKTEQLRRDLDAADWSRVDVVSISGSGEPTLALNLGEALRMIKDKNPSGAPVRTVVLTNAFHLHDPEVRRDLSHADEVAAKLDAATDEMLSRVNRPVETMSVERIVEGIKLFRAEYDGRLAIQTMLTPVNIKQIGDIGKLIRRIGPDEVQLNAPRRFYPMVWRQENRGRHDANPPDYEHRRLKMPEQDQLREALDIMKEESGVSEVSVYSE
ncbi:MAG: radical SAM protein [Proteobacteria bacterium]|nr:radical SAM protein [Pseudomonadota bacterium]